jgi:hypothetical protein
MYPSKTTASGEMYCMSPGATYATLGVTGLATLKESRANPSIYVGETSRNLKERSLEHHNHYQQEKEDSHM